MAYLYFLHDKGNNVMRGVHTHRRHELYYLVRGKTKYINGDEIYTVEEGNVVFTPKGFYHMTESGTHLNTERYLIAFDESTFDEDTRAILDELSTAVVTSIPVNKREGLESLFATLERSMDAQGAISEAAKKIYTLSILYYVCCHRRKFEPRVSETDKIVHDASDYINVHYSEDITLATLARALSVSESYISRRFKEVSGVGINEYITFVRIMNAERLLKEGGRSITEISALCGFNDPNYFSTVFKRIKGVTLLKFSKSSSV